MYEVLRYQAEGGHQPFAQWLNSIQDKPTQARIRVRLRRLEAGLFGDCQPVGGGVLELREHVGAGWRWTKRTQARVIELAKAFWADWKRRQP